MIVYTATVGDLDVTALGHWTTREGRDEAVVALARDGKVTGRVDYAELEVTGDPTVIVLVDDDGRLAAGPFDDHGDAADYSPEEELYSGEWSVGRYAEALADQRADRAVVDLARRIEAELAATRSAADAQNVINRVRAELPGGEF